MEGQQGGGVEEMRIWPVPAAGGVAASAGASAGAPAQVYLTHFAQQHSNDNLRAVMLSALGTMASIGVAGAAGGLVDAIDTSSAFAAVGAGPPQLQGLPRAKNASLAELADFAAAQFRLEEQKLVHGGEGVVKKSSRKSSKAQMQAVEVEEDASAGDDSKGDEDESKGISGAMLGEMYHEITHQSVKHRDCFKKVVRKYSKMYGVTETSLRSILSFKNRRGDSSQFWSDDLWELYNKSVRCEICREQFSKGSRVLCTHFGRGRPSASQERHEVVAARFRQSSAAAGKGKEGKAKERNNGLQRAYNVQILLPAVWACLGCPDSKKFVQSKGAAHAK